MAMATIGLVEIVRRGRRQLNIKEQMLRLAECRLQREIAERAREKELFRKAEQNRKSLPVQQARHYEFLEKLIESATVAVAVVQGPQFRFILANSGYRATTGKANAELLGHTVAEVFPEAFAGGVDKFLKDAYSTGKTVTIRDFEVSLGPGREHTWWNAEYVPLRDEAGQVDSLLILARNVTDEVLARRRAEEMAAEAQAANKAKSQFLANISHELRTPMSAILGMTELALAEELSPLVHDYLRTAKDSADVLLLLLNEILDFSRMEAGRFSLDHSPFNLRTLVSEMVRSLAVHAYEKGLEMACELPASIPEAAIGDRLRLRQVLVNLVSNAIKFTHRGEVTVRARLVEKSGDNLLLEFSVSDTGLGISEEDQRRIFDPFTQADSSMTRGFGGAGLGLSIAANLVHMMGGQIGVESALGRGSTFRFTARLGRQPVTEPPRILPLVIKPLQGVRVLVADRNATARGILGGQLDEWGMRPELAADAAGAMRVLKEAVAAGSRIPLVLADSAMPGLNGCPLTETILQSPQLAGVMILLVSPSARNLNRHRRVEEKSQVRLEKPVLQPELLRALVQAMGVNLQPISASNNGSAFPAEAAARTLRVLLAEDTPANQKLVSRILAKRGHVVVVAEDGHKAVDLVREQDFDLVLMDVQMPVMDGFQATAAIRALPGPKSSTPVVAMTAHAMKGDEERCLGAGMDAYITKPLNSRELLEMVESLGHRVA